MVCVSIYGELLGVLVILLVDWIEVVLGKLFCLGIVYFVFDLLCMCNGKVMCCVV